MWAALLVGLVASGVAGIVNQVIWQRALKIFLGGSETLSAMVVVLVFMAGLGLGAAVASRWAPRLSDPLRTLAAVELGLAAINAAVALTLGLDITESVYAAQRMAVSVGVPLRAMYAVGCAVLLLPPTLGMGATLPFASEAAQRQLGATASRLVPVLLFVNTVGAAVGAYGSSAWLLPAFGQRRSLFLAVGCNLAAGLLIGVVGRAPPVAPREPTPRGPASRLSREEWLGGVLGFLSLGYEMALFRVLALTHDPVPTTFATGLGGFLLAWSLGVAGSERVTRRGGPLDGVGLAAGLGAASLAVVPGLFLLEWNAEETLPLWVSTAVYVAPCLAFGASYGALVARSARDWGRDVGRYAAVNTVGSCFGILFFTLVGYEMAVWWAIGAIALGVAAIAVSELAPSRVRVPAVVSVAIAAVVALGIGGSAPYTWVRSEDGVDRTYWGRDGVVEVFADGNIHIDGLWHTRLTDGVEHVGHPYTWMMAFGAVAAHHDRPRNALVIGAGVGISSACLAGVDGIHVDGYEIDHTLKRVLRDYPAQTLDALSQPNVRWMWQDARTGLALNETRYDVILSAPLYLRQAGSSLLLSREYLRLVKSRLAPDGVLAVYSNEGSDAQTRLVQATLAELFAYRVTWYDGIVTVASDRPITVTPEHLERVMARPDRLFREARTLDASLAAEGGLFGLYDGDRYTGDLADRVITDDQPLVEYPDLADRWVGRAP